MKALTFAGIEKVELVERPEPVIEEAGDVIVEIEAAGLCGSDMHPYFGRERGIDPGTTLGHEFVGRVRSGAGRFDPASRFVAPFTTSCGDCPPCRSGLTARCDHGALFGWVEGGVGLQGAQAEQVRVPLAASTLVAVPDELDDPGLALLAGDVLSTGLFGAESARVGEGDLVVVVGCGPVGLMAIRAALHRGARAVVAVDRVESRLETAARFGADAVHLDDSPRARVDRWSEGRGADAAIEAVGTPRATRAAADLLRPGAVLVAVGVHTEPQLALGPGEMYDRNLTYVAGRCPARRFLPEALEVATRDRALLTELITHRLPLEEGPAAYRAFGAREPGWGKVIFLPGS